MPPGVYCIVFLCLFASSTGKNGDNWELSNTMSKENGERHEAARFQDTIDIDNNQGSSVDSRMSDMPGSGDSRPNDEWVSSGWPEKDTDDEDSWENDQGFSGIAPNLKPTPRGQTKCEQLRASIKRQPLEGAFYPRCTSQGEYQAVQCDNHLGTCWCVTKWGLEIPNTRGRSVTKKDCPLDGGINRPEKKTGYGNGAPNEKVVEPVEKFEKTPVEPPRTNAEPDNGITYENPKENPGVEIKQVPEGEDDEEEEPTGEGTTPKSNNQGHRSPIISTPGLLPGIIGGAVVGLLCAVLLVMFIVYRMRKKDEGSYALEEPKMTSPSRGYTRAPTKEYWA